MSTSIDTSTIFLDIEALQIEEEQHQSPSSWWISASGNIVSVSIRRSSPQASSVGSSTIHTSSLASQCAITPMAHTPSHSQVLSTLHFESSPLRFETASEPQTPTSQTASSNLKLKSWYSSRSILGPDDLKVMAVLETTC